MELILERSVSLGDAEKAVDEYFQKRNIAVEIEKYGSILSSTVATMKFSHTDEEDCVGCGKGYQDEARVGAKYEAYEHHQGLVQLRRFCALVPFDEILSQSATKDLLPLKILSESNPSQISALTMDPMYGKTERLVWPAFMIDYRYPSNKLEGDDANYEAARRYSCGTGFASGLGFTEAALHAVSEVIERHCVGVYLARTFFYESDAEVKCINPCSMPEVLRQTLKDAEAELRNEIQLIDITLDNLPPVYIAYCRDNPISGIQIFGSGCSYYASHAANRAIKELVQLYSIEEGVQSVRKEWKRHKAHLQKYPKLLRCLISDISSKKILVQDFKQDAEPLTLKSHLQYLFRVCDEAKLPVWIKELDSDPSGVSLVCAIMPKMERFSIVTLGNYVVPTAQYEELKSGEV